jgi:hypothetical protein
VEVGEGEGARVGGDRVVEDARERVDEKEAEEEPDQPDAGKKRKPLQRRARR